MIKSVTPQTQFSNNFFNYFFHLKRMWKIIFVVATNTDTGCVAFVLLLNIVLTEKPLIKYIGIKKPYEFKGKK